MIHTDCKGSPVQWEAIEDVCLRMSISVSRLQLDNIIHLGLRNMKSVVNYQEV